MASEVPPKPVPVPDARSEGFWSAAAQHVLAIQQCTSCGGHAYPPVDLCRHCLSGERSFTFRPVSGQGRIKTWTVMRQAFLPGFVADLPYVVAEVVLDDPEGIRMVGQVVGCQIDDIRLDAPVSVVFEDVAADLAVAQFALSSTAGTTA